MQCQALVYQHHHGRGKMRRCRNEALYCVEAGGGWPDNDGLVFVCALHSSWIIVAAPESLSVESLEDEWLYVLADIWDERLRAAEERSEEMADLVWKRSEGVRREIKRREAAKKRDGKSKGV